MTLGSGASFTLSDLPEADRPPSGVSIGSARTLATLLRVAGVLQTWTS